MEFNFFWKRGSDDEQPKRAGSVDDALHRMVDEVFADASINLPFDCGFDPNDPDPERKNDIDRIRSKMLRLLFITDEFKAVVTKCAKEVMEHELSAAWDRGESIDQEAVLGLRHLVTHVAGDLIGRFTQQAVEPFIGTLIDEDRYCKNYVHPTVDFAAAQVPRDGR